MSYETELLVVAFIAGFVTNVVLVWFFYDIFKKIRSHSIFCEKTLDDDS